MGQDNLNKAKVNKKDEFYTLYEDIEKWVEQFKEELKDKIIYCNCDDYRVSNFVKFFKDNFDNYGIKRLVTTNFDIGNGAWKYVYDGTVEVVEKLEGDGSFDSEECKALLDEVDVVVTNPPFSLFRKFGDVLQEKKKKFIVVGSINAITYKNLFPSFKKNEVGVGSGLTTFELPDNYVPRSTTTGYFEKDDKKYQKFGSVVGFTNVKEPDRPKLELTATFDINKYPMYDNYCAFECSRVKDIPKDEFIIVEIPDEDWPKGKEAYGDDVSIVEDENKNT